MSEAELEVITAGADDADASVIMLHGLGADGHDLEGLAPHLEARVAPRLRFLFPNAPVRPVTLNAGMAMRAWYDIDPSRGADAATPEIEAAARQTATLVRAELTRGLAPASIVLGGFSQGGVVALHTALRTLDLDAPLAGVAALSTYVHEPQGLDQEATPHARSLPVFMAHGLEDPMIPIARAAQGRAALERLGLPLEWHEYPMGHEICLEEIEALAHWLDARLAKPG